MKQIITIPRNLAREGDLVLIPRKKYEELLKIRKVTEEDVLRWAKEAKFLKKNNKLPKLKFWVDLEK
jgi:protein involved in polysaccharide export with SLBB domain